MLSLTSERIFVYDSDPTHLSAYRDFFDSRSLPMFGTDNIYKLTQYSKEITPEIMVFNLNKNSELAMSVLNDLSEKKYLQSPILVLNPHNIPFKPVKNIAHYLTAPIDVKKFADIIESYCIGHKEHQIMLIESARSEASRLQKQLDERHYNYFQVYNGVAANRYLSKNHPKIVCIEYSISFIVERHNLPHDRIIYVDRQQDITEIEKFLI